MSSKKTARFYRVNGRVQGVGFRYFVEQGANSIGLRGWVRNADDGSVEVYASGNAAQLSELEGLLWKGPRLAEVRGVEQSEAALEEHHGFFTRH